MTLIIRVQGKSDDRNSYSAVDNGVEIAEGTGYLPNFPGFADGDYFDVQIDAATGQILNWKPMTADQIREAIEEA